MDELNFETFVRRPFTVEAVLITEENIAEIADLIGKLKTGDDGSPFIAIDKRIVPNMTRAFLGWYMTRLNDNYRCYAPKPFFDQFQPEDLVEIPYEGADATRAEGVERPTEVQ